MCQRVRIKTFVRLSVNTPVIKVTRRFSEQSRPPCHAFVIEKKFHLGEQVLTVFGIHQIQMFLVDQGCLMLKPGLPGFG